MADRIKGITIEIGGNTTKLQSSLKDVNKSIKETQGQLKDVDKLLKLDPKNIELLSQKQELLGRATEQTAEKLAKLKEAQEQMKNAGVDELSSEYMALNREIIETEQSMDKLEAETKKTNETISKVSSNLDKVADATGKMAEKTRGLSTAAAGALGGLVAMGVKAGKDADDLNTLAKQTGLSTEALQKMAYASDLIDVNVDDITGAVKKMKKQLDSSEVKFKNIGVATRDANDEYRATEDIFYDVITALGGIENETERDIVAMDIFGKSADELAGIIDDGGAALKALGEQAEANGSIISQEDLDKANEFNDTLDQLKAQLSGSFGQAAVSVMQALTPLLEKLAPIIQNIAQWIGNLSPTAMAIIGIVLGIVAALSPLLGLISAIAGALPVITTVVGAITAPMLGIIAVIGLVIAAVVVLIKHWDDIKTAAKLVGEIVAEKFKAMKDKVVQVFTDMWNKVKEKFDAIKNKATEVVNNLKNLFDNIKLKLPDIKLPHFKIDGELSINPPSVPKLSIDWYRKAYDDAYILNSPTIFGAAGGQLLGGGEGNGSETIVGTQKLMSMMSEVLNKNGSNVTVVLEGDAAQIFKLNRVENSKFVRATGYRPLA